jgi:hypothetical protein
LQDYNLLCEFMSLSSKYAESKQVMNKNSHILGLLNNVIELKPPDNKSENLVKFKINFSRLITHDCYLDGHFYVESKSPNCSCYLIM